MKTINELVKLAQPAQRALAGAKIIMLPDLVKHTESEIAKLHGIGNNALKKLKEALEKEGLSFRK